MKVRDIVECMNAAAWGLRYSKVPKLTEGRCYVVKEVEMDNVRVEDDTGRLVWANKSRFTVIRVAQPIVIARQPKEQPVSRPYQRAFPEGQP